MARIIGIQHRVKMSAAGEARPTQVAILDNGTFSVLELATEQDEAQFVMNSLNAGDVIGMVLGGSGDYLAYAIYRRAQTIGAQILRIPSYALKQARDGASYAGQLANIHEALLKKKTADQKADDHILLALMLSTQPDLFYELADTDATLIRARENWRALWESMQARMAAAQRLRQLYIGRAFTSPDGLFPEGGVEKGFDAVKASDPILAALEKEERKRERELVSALEELEVYNKIFLPIPGIGPKIAGRIISAVVDIRRFGSGAKLKAYMGVHVLPDGRFPRRRHGTVANWHGDARQALYLLGDQFNRRPNSYWGQYLKRMKVALREKHPEPVIGENGKKKYTDGHIHKMATWRTLSRFVEQLYRDWSRLTPAPESAKELRKAA